MAITDSSRRHGHGTDPLRVPDGPRSRLGLV